MKKIIATGLIILALVGVGCKKPAPTITLSPVDDNQDTAEPTMSSSTVPIAEAPVTVKTFRDEQYNMAFKYPGNWTYTKDDNKNSLVLSFKDENNQPAMSLVSPIPDTGVEGVELFREENIITTDNSTVRLSLLRSCSNDDCTEKLNGLDGAAAWRNALIHFNSFAPNNSPEEEKNIKNFQMVIQSLTTVK